MKRSLVIGALVSLSFAFVIYLSIGRDDKQVAGNQAGTENFRHDFSVERPDEPVTFERGGSKIHSVPEEIARKTTGSEPLVLSDISEYQTSLVEGFAEMALSYGWSYDAQVNNLGLWGWLCTANRPDISALLDESGTSSAGSPDIAMLCEDYDSVVQEIEDVFLMEEMERETGMDERSRLELSLDESGPDLATRLAIAELSQSLEALDYARALDIVWFLAFFDFSEVSDELSVYGRQPSVQVVFAVTTSIFCGYIGGCSGRHPLTLNLCFYFEGLPCSTAPANVYDAIDQILTGHEIDTFNEMNQSLIRLINRHRLGDL